MQFLKKIFSIQNHDFSKVICILGFKIRIHNSRRDCQAIREWLGHLSREDLYWSSAFWEKSGTTKALLDYFALHSCSPHAWRHYHPHFWLVYLSCLIESGSTQQAQSVLTQYMRYHNLLDIERYFTVAKFALNIGISNAEIIKAGVVHKKLLESHAKGLICLNNKKVAVVGNAPSEIGKNKGAEIDAHDIVIRFNNYQTSGYEKDYGLRTDVWVRGSGGSDVLDRKEKFELVIWEADYEHWCVRYDHLDILNRMINEGQNIYNFDFDSHLSLKQESKIDFPTTGLMLLWQIYREFGSFKNFSFYGFNFCNEEYDTYSTHYFNDRDEEQAKRYSSVHNLYQEAVFAKKLLFGEN